MIDLSKHVLPSAVVVRGKAYPIKTDFAYWIRFTELIKDKQRTFDEFDHLYWQGIPRDRAEGFRALLGFCFVKEELPKIKSGSGVKAIDYQKDGSFIYAAFMQCYGIDLVDTPLHWHKFLALLGSLEGTRLNQIIAFRTWEKSDEKYESYMARMRDAWGVDEPDAEAEEAARRFNEVFD